MQSTGLLSHQYSCAHFSLSRPSTVSSARLEVEPTRDTYQSQGVCEPYCKPGNAPHRTGIPVLGKPQLDAGRTKDVAARESSYHRAGGEIIQTHRTGPGIGDVGRCAESVAGHLHQPRPLWYLVRGMAGRLQRDVSPVLVMGTVRRRGGR